MTGNLWACFNALMIPHETTILMYTVVWLVQESRKDPTINANRSTL